jgi:hypothetical protein
MADERGHQESESGQETVVGRSLVDEPEQPTAVHATETTAGDTPSSGWEPPPAADRVPTPDAPAPAEQVGDTGRAEVFFSRDEAQQQQAAPTPPPPSYQAPTAGSSPAEADRIAAEASARDAFAEKPLLYVLGAFAAAFVFAQLLKRITGGGRG